MRFTDKDKEQIDEVHRCYGAAMDQVQSVEGLLANMFLSSKLPDRHKMTRSELDDMSEKQRKKMMGKLLKDVEKACGLPPATIERLKKALDTRNMLVHRYFNERLIENMSRNGRHKMARELMGIEKEMSEVNAMLISILDSVSEKYGFTKEVKKKGFERLIAKAKEIDGEGMG